MDTIGRLTTKKGKKMRQTGHSKTMRKPSLKGAALLAFILVAPMSLSACGRGDTSMPAAFWGPTQNMISPNAVPIKMSGMEQPASRPAYTM